jgi:hypothetical protein
MIAKKTAAPDRGEHRQAFSVSWHNRLYDARLAKAQREINHHRALLHR